MHSFLVFLTDFADLAVILPLTVVVALSLAIIGWRRGALAWLVTVPGTLAAVLVLKVLVLAYAGSLVTSGLRNPSGHTAAGAVAYGGLAALLGSRFAAPTGTALLAAAGAALVFGLTRVILGAHTMADVLAGAALGIAGVLALVRLAGPRPPEAGAFGLVAVAAAVVLAFHGHRLFAEEAIRSIAKQIGSG